MGNTTLNRFKTGVTDTVYIHAGRFHADDMMFAALAELAIKRSGKKPTIIRTNDVESLRGENIIIGDIGRGVYDHHMEDGNFSLGTENNNEDYYAAACGLLYKDVSRLLFKENTETKAVFEAFLDIIEHCDNTSDNNTFSDSVNYFTPTTNNDLVDERAELAMKYCKDIIMGFLEAHQREKSGKVWAIPKVNTNVLPGHPSKIDERYKKASRSIKKKYLYISFNDKKPIKLRSMDAYSVAMSVLSADKRRYWREMIEKLDLETQNEVERLEAIEWPEAVADMKHRVLYVSNYIPWTKHIKDINAVFVVQESLRGGYGVTPIKTVLGNYRCSPAIIVNAAGCIYVANESRFLLFETKEQAFAAAESAGKMIDSFLEEEGIKGYRQVYGGTAEPPQNNDFQSLICEDLAIKAYVRDKVKDINNLTDDEFYNIVECVYQNDSMKHVICAHIAFDGGTKKWIDDVNVIDAFKNNGNVLLNTLADGVQLS